MLRQINRIVADLSFTALQEYRRIVFNTKLFFKTFTGYFLYYHSLFYKLQQLEMLLKSHKATGFRLILYGNAFSFLWQ